MINPYLQAFNAFTFPCLILEPKGRNFVITDANSRYCSLIGVPRDEVLGETYPFCSGKTNLQEHNRRKILKSLEKVNKQASLTK